MNFIEYFMIIENNVLFVYTLLSWFPFFKNILEVYRERQKMTWYKLLDGLDEFEKSHSSNDPKLTPEKLKKKRNRDRSTYININ